PASYVSATALSSFPTRRSSDLQLRQSSAFAALQDAHQWLLADLTADRDCAQSLDACRRAALAVDARLDAFFTASIARADDFGPRSEEHTSELQSRENLVFRLLL